MKSLRTILSEYAAYVEQAQRKATFKGHGASPFARTLLDSVRVVVFPLFLVNETPSSVPAVAPGIRGCAYLLLLTICSILPYSMMVCTCTFHKITMERYMSFSTSLAASRISNPTLPPRTHTPTPLLLPPRFQPRLLIRPHSTRTTISTSTSNSTIE